MALSSETGRARLNHTSHARPARTVLVARTRIHTNNAQPLSELSSPAFIQKCGDGH